VDVGVESGGGFGEPFVSPGLAGGLFELFSDLDASVSVADVSSLTSGDGGMSPSGRVIGGGGSGSGESVRSTIASARLCARCALRVVSITTTILGLVCAPYYLLLEFAYDCLVLLVI
jgi:hypothetical protein